MKKYFFPFTTMLVGCLLASALHASGHKTGATNNPPQETKARSARILVLDADTPMGNVTLLHILNELETDKILKRPEEFDLRSYFNAYCALGHAQYLAQLYCCASGTSKQLPRWKTEDLLSYFTGEITSDELSERSLMNTVPNATQKPGSIEDALTALLREVNIQKIDTSVNNTVLLQSLSISGNSASEENISFSPLAGKGVYMIEECVCNKPSTLIGDCEVMRYTLSTPAHTPIHLQRNAINCSPVIDKEKKGSFTHTIPLSETNPYYLRKEKLKGKIACLIDVFQTKKEIAEIEVIYLRARDEKRGEVLEEERRILEVITDDLKKIDPKIKFIPVLVETCENTVIGEPNLNSQKQLRDNLSQRIERTATGMFINDTERQLGTFYEDFLSWPALPKKRVIKESLLRTMCVNVVTTKGIFHPKLIFSGPLPREKQGLDSLKSNLENLPRFTNDLELYCCSLNRKAIGNIFEALFNRGRDLFPGYIKISDDRKHLTSKKIEDFVSAWSKTRGASQFEIVELGRTPVPMDFEILSDHCRNYSHSDSQDVHCFILRNFYVPNRIAAHIQGEKRSKKASVVDFDAGGTGKKPEVILKGVRG